MSQEEDAVRGVVTRLVHDLDAKRWHALRPRFTAEVATDYRALFGGAPRRDPSELLVGGWAERLARVATQHLLGPIDVTVTDGRATAHCHVRASHFVDGAPGGESWEVLGHYVFTLRREGAWRIEGLTLETYRQLGNRQLLVEAGQVR